MISGRRFLYLTFFIASFAAIGFFVYSLSYSMPKQNKKIPEPKINLHVSSIAFAPGESISSKYTCDGENILPPLSVGSIPPSAQSLVFIMDDPDSPSGTWDHWVLFNVSTSTTEVREGVEPDGEKGLNSWGKQGYGGPCPGKGEHRYFFKVYALNSKLSFREAPTKTELEEKMKEHLIASGELMGRYKRPGR
jgi:Raf kinase inhibitor-like YbhB/YbcL family protein